MSKEMMRQSVDSGEHPVHFSAIVPEAIGRGVQWYTRVTVRWTEEQGEGPWQEWREVAQALVPESSIELQAMRDAMGVTYEVTHVLISRDDKCIHIEPEDLKEKAYAYGLFFGEKESLHTLGSHTYSQRRYIPRDENKGRKKGHRTRSPLR